MIKERIVQLIEFKGIAKENFYKKIEMTSANFRGQARNTPINSNAIGNILSEIPDLNLYWLISGEGEMLKNSGDSIKIDQPNAIRDKLIERQDQLIELLGAENKNLKQEITKLKKEKEPHFYTGMVAEDGKELTEKYIKQSKTL